MKAIKISFGEVVERTRAQVVRVCFRWTDHGVLARTHWVSDARQFNRPVEIDRAVICKNPIRSNLSHSKVVNTFSDD